MTGPPVPTRTHTWDGTRTLPDWLDGHHHWDGDRLVVHHRDDDTPIQPGWMIVEWSDGTFTAASPRVAERVYGPDGLAGRLTRAEARLTAVADLIADHEGDDWAAHPATSTLRGILDDPATSSDEADLTGYLAPDPPIGCLTVAAAPTGPSGQYEAAIHQAFLTTPTRIPGGQPRPGTPDSHVHGAGHVYDMTCALCRGDSKALAAAVLAVRDQQAATLAAVTAEAARRGVISIDGIRNIVRRQATSPVHRVPCPHCEGSPARIPRQLLAEHVATVHPDVRTAEPGKEQQ